MCLNLVRKFKKLFVLIVLAISFTSINARADFAGDVKTAIENISCETMLVFGDSLHYSCTIDSLLNEAIANLASPGTYFFAMTHGKMRDEEILPGNCSRIDRSDPATGKTKIDFAFCSNILLNIAKITATAKVAAGALDDLFHGQTPNLDDALKQIFNPEPQDYHEFHRNTSEGASGVFLDYSAIIPWTVQKDKDRICVATRGFIQWINFGCKLTKEPYPEAKYAQFFDRTPPAYGVEANKSMSCAGISSCYETAVKSSKTNISISGPIVNCIRQMLVKTLVSDTVCEFNSSDLNNSNVRKTSALYTFQKNMRTTVSALLTLYIMLIGFRTVISGGNMKQGEIITAAIKVILVSYFAVGISQANGSSVDGMTEYVFPLLFGASSQMASWVMNGTANGFCEFIPSDYSNVKDTYLTLWDALDCRLSHYLGLETIENAGKANSVLDAPIPAYVVFLGPAIYTGNLALVMLVLAYPIMVISVAAYMVHAFVVGLMMTAILGLFAPLFIPMVLFSFTEKYFKQWLKLLISFIIQPLVVTVFVITMFSIYDEAYYTGCKFTNTIDDGKKVFSIDSDSNNYIVKEDYEKCMHSLGWMINSPFKALKFGSLEIASKATNDIANKSEDAASNIFSAIKQSPGFFFNAPSLLINLLVEFMSNLLICCFLLYLMYHLSSQISQFASDLSGGISLDSYVVGAQSFAKKAIYGGELAEMYYGEKKLVNNQQARNNFAGGAGNPPPAAPRRAGGAPGNMPPPPPRKVGAAPGNNAAPPPPKKIGVAPGNNAPVPGNAPPPPPRKVGKGKN